LSVFGELSSFQVPRILSQRAAVLDRQIVKQKIDRKVKHVKDLTDLHERIAKVYLFDGEPFLDHGHKKQEPGDYVGHVKDHVESGNDD